MKLLPYILVVIGVVLDILILILWLRRLDSDVGKSVKKAIKEDEPDHEHHD